MIYKILFSVITLLIVSSLYDVHCQDELSGYRIDREASYFIVAPRNVHPNQVVQMSVTILEMFYDNINIRISVRRHSEEMGQAFQTFYTTGTTIMQLKMPENADGGNYTLRIEGTTDRGIGGYIFENETELIFETKQCSLFIQVNKPFFRQGQTVYFRIMPVEKNLMSRSGSMDIYIIDSTNTIVRRWLSMQTNAGGALDMVFPLSEQPHYGMWQIEVHAFGHVYHQSFRVDEFFITAIDVNVSMPLYMMEDEFGLAGVISANLSLGQPVKGTAKVKLDVYRPLHDRTEGEKPLVTIEHESRYFPGVQDFLFPMSEVRLALENVGQELPNKELYVTAEVYDWFLVQSATGKAICVVYDNEVELKLLGDSARVFKPNQTMAVYFAAVHKDGTPLYRLRRQVTVDRSEDGSQGIRTFQDKFLVGDDGIAQYKFTPHEYATFIRITAYYDNYASQLVEVTAFRHYSPTESYIFLTTSTESPSADQYMVFTVSTNTFVENVNYVVTAGGNIVTGGVMEMSSRQKTFSLSVSRDMIPQAHLIVWHIFHGEVIADSLNFFVNGTRLNPIDVRFNRGKDFTGDLVEINAWTDPASFIGFNAIDYELWAYGYNPFITESMIIEELSTFDSHVNKSFMWKWKLPEEQDHYVHFPAPNYGVDANQTFVYAGLLVFTDANVTRIPHYCNETLGYHPCMDGTCYEEDKRCDGARQCEDGQDEMGCVYPVDERFTAPTDRLGLVTRHYVMDGFWLWGSHFVLPNGRLDAITEVPDEPMAWILSSFGISKDLGFGIMYDPVRHQATRPFYMRIEAPSDVIKGEQIGIRVGLFNYFNEDLEAIVMLHDSDQYRFVIVEESGIVSSYSPRTISGDIQTMVFMEMSSVYEIQIPILPIVDGCITVRITANAFIYGDHEELEICSKYDGVTNHLHTPFFIDLINSGSLVLPDLEIPVPERFVKPEERQHLYVPGSPQAYVGIVGDVVGPGFFAEYLDAEVTLNKPYGSAEQNMYNFAYTLYNLLYLKATNQLPDDTLEKALNHMNLGLQRQLGYMNFDGSFSQFRDYHEYTPSVWVTAFAMRTINDAQERDWELDFFIPTALLNKMMLWLCGQQKIDGKFVEISPIYDRKFKHNVTASHGLTAYVLITLARATRVTSNADACRASAIGKAVSYLEHSFMSIPTEEADVFETCIVTYALHLAGSQRATEAFYRLEEIKITKNYVYWADKEIPPNDIRTVDTIPYYQPRRWYDNEGYGVDATSYGLLTYMIRNQISDSVPIMKWLQTMRNTYAGQASTQDSITCLQALVEYAKRDTNRALYNIEVIVEATSMGNFSESVRLDSSNWANMQEISIFPVWGSVRGRAQGTGMALMQLATYVNVEYPHQILPAAEGKFFDVDILEYNFTGKNFSIMEVTPCARWVHTERGQHSGMAVMEIHIPTGYVVTNDVLRLYVQEQNATVTNLRRAETYGRKVMFYFDYQYLNMSTYRHQLPVKLRINFKLDSVKATCVKFRMDRWFPVANMTIQHHLKVYDYYEPGMHNTSLYTTWGMFTLHMCQVCGSFQCPYCRYYNTASVLQHSSILPVITVILVFLINDVLSRRSLYGLWNSVS